LGINALLLTGGLPSVLLRGGVMAAVTLQKWQCVIAREYPAGSAVEASPLPSRRDVSGNTGTA